MAARLRGIADAGEPDGQPAERDDQGRHQDAARAAAAPAGGAAHAGPPLAAAAAPPLQQDGARAAPAAQRRDFDADARREARRRDAEDYEMQMEEWAAARPAPPGRAPQYWQPQGPAFNAYPFQQGQFFQQDQFLRPAFQPVPQAPVVQFQPAAAPAAAPPAPAPPAAAPRAAPAQQAEYARPASTSRRASYETDMASVAASEDSSEFAPRTLKRALDEFHVEHEALVKARRITPVQPSDTTGSARIQQLQYAVTKMTDADRQAAFIQRHYDQDDDLVDRAASIRKSLDQGVTALSTVMQAVASATALGQDFVVTATSAALSKDLDDFSKCTGFSASLAEEFAKREVLLSKSGPGGGASAARSNGAGRGSQCHNCQGYGHMSATCSSSGGGMYGRPPGAPPPRQRAPGQGGPPAAPVAPAGPDPNPPG